MSQFQKSSEADVTDAKIPEAVEEDYYDEDDNFISDEDMMLPPSIKSLLNKSSFFCGGWRCILHLLCQRQNQLMDSKKMSHAISNAVTKMQHLKVSAMILVIFVQIISIGYFRIVLSIC